MKDNSSNSGSHKIIIETKEDIYKLPINILKTANILDFSGKYFDKIYACALGLKTNPKIEHNESIVSFNSVKTYQTETNKKNINNPKKKSSKKPTTKNIKKNNNTKTKVEKVEQQAPYILNNTQTNDNLALQLSSSAPIKNNYYNDDYADYYNSYDVDNTLPLTHKNYPNTVVHNKTNSISNKKLKIDKIIFEINYNTKIGENLGIIGSIPELGSWKENNALKMTWNENNIWKGHFYYNSTVEESFEFKFIISFNGVVKQWESGNNRKFSMNMVKKMIESNINGDIVTLKGISGSDIVYNPKDNNIIIKCDWNKK